MKVDLDPNEENVDDVYIYNEWECHQIVVLEENYGGVDDKRALFHAKTQDVYINEN